MSSNKELEEECDKLEMKITYKENENNNENDKSENDTENDNDKSENLNNDDSKSDFSSKLSSASVRSARRSERNHKKDKIIRRSKSINHFRASKIDYHEYNSVKVNKKKSSSAKRKISSPLSVSNLYKIIDQEDKEIEISYLFNKNPVKYISNLCKFYGKEETPIEIARLMRNTPGLLGEKIGEYLSRKENTEILNAYFMDLNLKTNLIQAMRNALSGPLYLPGEAQEIDRVVQSFSNSYSKQNPEIIQNPEVTYILSFALIMLNSDLHNPSVQKKMTCNEFIQNTKHSLNCDTITDEDLTLMYENVKEKAFKFTDSSNVFLAMSAPKLKGFLDIKEEKTFASWKRYYFVLANSCLYYFKDDSKLRKDDPLGMIQLIEIRSSLEEKKNIISISTTSDQIQCVKFDKKMPKIVNGIKKIYFRTEDEDTRNKWLIRIKRSGIYSQLKKAEPI